MIGWPVFQTILYLYGIGNTVHWSAAVLTLKHKILNNSLDTLVYLFPSDENEQYKRKSDTDTTKNTKLYDEILCEINVYGIFYNEVSHKLFFLQ